jgi:CelD/BcsL family acetyltransferase involved in cellulose biosynthesis
MLQTRILRTKHELDAFRAEWVELLNHPSVSTVFQSPDWTMGWWDVVQPKSQLYCVAFYDGAQLVGFAPWCIVTRWGIRAIQFMGGAANDANEFAARAGYEQTLGNCLADVLWSNRLEWDAIELMPTSASDAVLDALRMRCAQDYTLVAARSTVHPYLALPPTWEQFWNELSRQKRRTWSYSRRLLERKGRVSFRVIADESGLAQAVPQFVAEHARNWQVRHQYHRLAPLNRMPEFQSVMAAVCGALAKREQVFLGQYCFDGTPIGWLIVLCQNDGVWEYMTTYDRAYAVYSPGVWVALETTKYLMTRGVKRYYLGRGEQPYKFWLGAKSAAAEPLLAAQKNPRGLFFSVYHRLHGRAADLYRALRKEE